MAKKNNTGLLIGVALIAFALLGKQRQRFTPNPNFPTLPPEPLPGTPNWAAWANGIIQIAGGLTSALFGPGGPFAGKTPEQVQQEQAAALGGGAWSGWTGGNP